MIAIKKKRILVFFFIIFFINIFLISKRRDFNFYNLKFIFDNEQISYINNNSNTVTKDNNLQNLNIIFIFLKKNKIEEVNFDKRSLKKNSSDNTIDNIIFFLYPIKYNEKSNYIISYFNDSKYSKCKLMIPKIFSDNKDDKLNNKLLTIYLCE